MFTETIQKAPIMNGGSMLDATLIVSTLDPYMKKITKEILFHATLSYPLPWGCFYRYNTTNGKGNASESLQFQTDGII
jgi:hypothetical protein